MSQTATARTLPLHDQPTTYGALQPSAMPRPPPSPAVHRAPSSRTTRPPEELSASARKIAPIMEKDKDKALLQRDRDRDRTVLGRVNVNAASAAAVKRAASRTTAKTKLSIPRPAAVADVFGEPPKASAALGKRSRTEQPATQAKRARPDASAVKALRLEQEQWLAKWQRAFPTLTFHFEIGAEEGSGRGLQARVTKLGARIDQFFSGRITHLVVKTAGSPQKPSAKASRRGQSDNPFLDRSPSDLVQKAEKYGIKVWTVKKLSEMLDALDPIDVAERDTLSKMLDDEKLHGTRERDQSAPRPDFYYFRPGSKYVLIEDATGRNRTVMVKEYSQKEQDWPVLHEHFLRLTSSCALPRSIKNTDHLHHDLRQRAMALYVNQESWNGEEPPAPSMKRSASMREFPVAPIPDELPYVKASGNSVVLTSNIASTSTANTNTPQGMQVNHPAGKRGAMQVSKRVEVLKRNMPGSRAPQSEKRASETLARMPTLGRRKSAGSEPSFTASKEFLSQAEVIAMLRNIRQPTNLTKPTFEERLANREAVDAGHKRKEQDTASGYCENCRIRYADLSVHMASRKHRRFATNRKNFADLDDMLHCLQRPPNPAMCIQTKVCRPCNRQHTKDAECGRCMDDEQLYSSPPPSTPGSATKQHMFGMAGYESEMEDDDEGHSEVEEEDEEMDEEPQDGEEVNDEAAEAADRE